MTPSILGPSTMPGSTAFTLMLSGPSSMASDFAIPTMAHFVATYGVRHGMPMRPATDEMQTMLAVLRLPQHRYSMMQAAVLAIQVYVDRAFPLLFGDLVHSSGRARDAGAINQDIEAVESGALCLEKRCDLRFIGHIGVGRLAGRKALLKCGQGSVVDIADVDFGARFRECGCNRGSNAGGASSHQDPQSLWRIKSILERHS